jgi:hypothetical protein
VLVQEDHPGHVRPVPWLVRAGRVDMPREQRVSGPVPGQHIAVPAQHQHRGLAQRLQKLRQLGRHPLRRRPACRGPGAGAGGQVVQVAALGLVESQRPGDRVEHLRRGVLRVALFQPGVVGGAHPGQQGQLLAAQARHPPAVAVPGQSHIRGPHLRPAGGQELAELPSAVHDTSISVLPGLSHTLAGVGTGGRG